MPYKLIIFPGINKPPISTDYNQQEQKKVISGRNDFRLVLYILRFRVPGFII
jgi:hypothetical protein